MGQTIAKRAGGSRALSRTIRATLPYELFKNASANVDGIRFRSLSHMVCVALDYMLENDPMLNRHVYAYAPQPNTEVGAGEEEKVKTETVDMPEGWTEFWEVYPRSAMETHALNAYATALETATPKEIMKGLKKAIKAGNLPGTKFPYASTWLHYRGWEMA